MGVKKVRYELRNYYLLKLSDNCQWLSLSFSLALCECTFYNLSETELMGWMVPVIRLITPSIETGKKLENQVGSVT